MAAQVFHKFPEQDPVRDPEQTLRTLRRTLRKTLRTLRTLRRTPRSTLSSALSSALNINLAPGKCIKMMYLKHFLITNGKQMLFNVNKAKKAHTKQLMEVQRSLSHVQKTIVSGLSDI
jgi:hypothetical protein